MLEILVALVEVTLANGHHLDRRIIQVDGHQETPHFQTLSIRHNPSVSSIQIHYKVQEYLLRDSKVWEISRSSRPPHPRALDSENRISPRDNLSRRTNHKDS